jgi:uncharacterized membrane protein YebE (DUF533 family)
MFSDMLLGSLVRGALGTRRRPHGRAAGFLTGGGSSLFNLTNLLGAAGLAWGAYEAFGQRRQGGSLTTVEGGGFEPAPESRPRTLVTGTPPPIPGTAGPPPLPGSAPASAGSAASAGDTEGLRRLVALTIAAARCDRELSEEEYGKILAAARESGGESLVASELANHRPVAAIVAGATDPRLKADLYVLAYGVVRADGRTSEVERAWLAELAGALGLDSAAVQALEKKTNTAIDGGSPA